MIKFKERLKELRIQAGYTQQQIADKLHVSQQSYARYELGTGEPNLDMLVKISQIFEVSVDYMLGIIDY